MPTADECGNQSKENKEGESRIKTIVKALITGGAIGFGATKGKPFLSEVLVVEARDAANVATGSDRRYLGG